MSGFKAYPAYKDSGVEWLGEVPEGWDVWKISHAFGELGSGTTPPTSETEWYEGGTVPWVTTGELRENVIWETKKLISSSALTAFPALRMHPAGSLAIAMYGATIGRLGILGVDATTNQACCLLIRPNHLDVKFTFYWLLVFKQSIIDLYAFGGGQSNINQETIANLKIPAPNVQDQIQIARFLDHETARIDGLIDEQQRLIELLKEKRQAVISEAVTKGLDPSVLMKDSGVEWLGKVPAHWETNALNKLTEKITNGYVGPTRNILVEGGVPYVQATHIKKGVVNFDGAYFVTSEWSNKMSKSILHEDDVLIVQTGAGTGDVGVVSLREVGYNCHALIILQTYKSMLSGVYLGRVLQSCFGQSVLFSMRTGGMHPHLNCGEVKFIKIPVPPLREQKEISDFVRCFSESAEQLIVEAGAAMNLLQERRSALISAAVTGKIDVRGWQPPATSPTRTAEAETA